jgi:thiol-disulfide isomerase/thioredoxin
MNKKYIPLIWLAVIVVVAAVIVAVVLTSNANPNGSTILKDGITLKNPYFSDKVIIIHKTGCPSCAAALPVLREIEQENNLTFYYYDVYIQSQLAEVTKLNIIPEYVPTVIIYGKVYVGAKTKEQYEAIILKQ